MPHTDEEQKTWEQQCFGCTQVEARNGIDRLVEFNNAGRCGPANMSLGSILSDAQELMERTRYDEARQYLNRVKMAIFDAAEIWLWKRQDEPPRRQLVVPSADYWFQAGRNRQYKESDRLLYLENAVNHVENTLLDLLEHPDRAEPLRDRLRLMRAG